MEAALGGGGEHLSIDQLSAFPGSQDAGLDHPLVFLRRPTANLKRAHRALKVLRGRRGRQKSQGRVPTLGAMARSSRRSAPAAAPSVSDRDETRKPRHACAWW